MDKYYHDERDESKNNEEQIYYSNSYWRKYDSYTIATGRNGLPLIIPEKNSNYIEYNPFDNYPAILEDFLNLIKDISLIHDNELLLSEGFINEHSRKLLVSTSKRVMRFVEKYGLLGMFKHDIERVSGGLSPGEWNIIDYNGLEYDFKDIFNKYSIYLDKIPSPGIEASHPSKIHGRIHSEKYFNLIDPYIGDPAFDLYYELLKYYLYTTTLWDDFERSGNQPDDTILYEPPHRDPKKIIWSEVLSEETEISNIGLSVRFVNGQPLLNWSYPSLLHALKIMYIYDKTVGDKIIASCQLCDKTFIKTKKTQKFCSSSCGNTMRQRTHRAKKSNLE